jgi:hypothetical protein
VTVAVPMASVAAVTTSVEPSARSAHLSARTALARSCTFAPPSKPTESLECLRIYQRALRTAEAVGNHRAGVGGYRCGCHNRSAHRAFGHPELPSLATSARSIHFRNRKFMR